METHLNNKDVFNLFIEEFRKEKVKDYPQIQSTISVLLLTIVIAFFPTWPLTIIHYFLYVSIACYLFHTYVIIELRDKNYKILNSLKVITIPILTVFATVMKVLLLPLNLLLAYIPLLAFYRKELVWSNNNNIQPDAKIKTFIDRHKINLKYTRKKIFQKQAGAYLTFEDRIVMHTTSKFMLLHEICHLIHFRMPNIRADYDFKMEIMEHKEYIAEGASYIIHYILYNKFPSTTRLQWFLKDIGPETFSKLQNEVLEVVNYFFTDEIPPFIQKDERRVSKIQLYKAAMEKIKQKHDNNETLSLSDFPKILDECTDDILFPKKEQTEKT